MKISEKLYKKYASNAVILPPPPDSKDLGEEEIPVDQEPSAAWSDMLFSEREALGDPLTEGPKETEEEILKKLNPSSIPPYEQELMDSLKKKERDTATVPPKKSASSDQILKMCSKYYDLCCKL